MTLPREVLPDQYYLVTRRCLERRFLLAPDDEINNAIAYCLAHAARRFEVVVLMTTVESNHHHTVIYDQYGRFPRFIEHFHKLVAKCVNVYRNRRENLWSSSETCVTRLLDEETILDKVAYTAANPVKDMLVERATQWPGLTGYPYLIHGKPLIARRPRFFFRKDRDWPEELPLTFTFPSQLGDREELIERLVRKVRQYEMDAAQLRQSSNRHLLGRKTVREQNWRLSPRTVERARELRPRFAGQRVARIKALEQYRAFLGLYREARKRWLRFGSYCFPEGTYWLARFTPLVKLTEAVN